LLRFQDFEADASGLPAIVALVVIFTVCFGTWIAKR
jgi:hypothetical protein